jgi:plastocyanin
VKKILSASLGAAILIAASAALAQTAGIEITKDGFKPADVSIQSGDSVDWKNSDTVAHDVVVDGTSCKLTLQSGQSSLCTFATPGTFAYSDPDPKATGFKGRITVAQNSRAVTLSSSRPLAIFGGAVTLSGTVSSKKAGEHVTVVARPVGEPAWRTEVVTTSGGNWSLKVQPRIRTVYQSTFETASSPALTIAVRPRLTLQKVAPHRFLVVVLAAHSMAGRTINLARYVPGAGWITFRHLQLGSIPRTDTIAVITFTSHVRLGTKLRVFLPTNQAAPDYLDGHSNFVVK